MKNFWGSFLGAFIGIVIASLLIFFIFFVLLFASVSGISSGTEKMIRTKPNSVLHITLNSDIPERTSKNPFRNFSFDYSQNHSVGLNDILANIEKAKNDKNIKGIYLDISSVAAGVATIEEIRNALIDFKQSKKFIVAYSEGFTQGAYYLATVSDKIYLNPEGMVTFKGLSSQVMFYKKMLDKLEVEMQVFRHGKFKSATEPFFLEKMSDANRLQTMSYVRSIWDHLLIGISKERNIPVDELNRYADNMLVNDAESSLHYKLVDSLVYKDQMLDVLADLTGDRPDKIKYVEMDKYIHAPKAKSESYTKNEIALIYASGEIMGGEGTEESIGSERISKVIREARLDKDVKAIVLRINSPGGSSVASDIIWREVMLAKKVKPVVVSMGDVAASGGYYIACAADAIVAEPNTITGSIGVFGVFPNAQNLFSNKLGITVDTVNSNKHSDIMSPYRAVGKEEGEVIQRWIENVYQDFISKVAAGRGMTVAGVDSIGQGRVWSGVDAKKIGLVDQFGGIKDAIALAADKAKLKQYKILELPKQKEPFEELLNTFMDQDAIADSKLRKELGSSYDNIKKMKNVLKYKGVQARMPYEVVLY